MKGFRLEKRDFIVLVGTEGKLPWFGGPDSQFPQNGKKVPHIVGISVGMDFDDVLPSEGMGSLKKQEKAFVEGGIPEYRSRPVDPPVFKRAGKVREDRPEKVWKIFSGETKNPHGLGNQGRDGSDNRFHGLAPSPPSGPEKF